VLVVRLSSQNVNSWRFKGSQPFWLGVFLFGFWFDGFEGGSERLPFTNNIMKSINDRVGVKRTVRVANEAH
jgi:hypothetical protein